MSDFKHDRTLKEIAEANKRWNAEQFETQAQRLELDGDIRPENPGKIKKLQEEITTLRQQLKQAEARVAELEKDNAHQRERRNAARDCINKMNGAWLLRKKAEGIDEAARELMPRMVGSPDDPMPEFNAAFEMCGEFMDYARRLRQQADEAERAGGEM